MFHPEQHALLRPLDLEEALSLLHRAGLPSTPFRQFLGIESFRPTCTMLPTWRFARPRWILLRHHSPTVLAIGSNPSSRRKRGRVRLSHSHILLPATVRERVRRTRTDRSRRFG